MSLVLLAAVVGGEILGTLLSPATGLPVTAVVTEIALLALGWAIVRFEFVPFLSTAKTNELRVRRKTASTFSPLSAGLMLLMLELMLLMLHSAD